MLAQVHHKIALELAWKMLQCVAVSVAEFLAQVHHNIALEQARFFCSVH